MIDLRALTDQLNYNRVTDYDLLLTPSPLDRAITDAIAAYRMLPPQERQSFRDHFGSDHTFTWFVYAIRMATFAVRERAPERVLNGLLALVIEDFKQDWRENLIILSLLHDSARRIGADPCPLFEQASGYAGPAAAQRIQQFAQRSPDLQRIESMGYRAVNAPAGFRYERI